ncbi:MAG TPA: tetraacyldisaccharide 4'-kinase [Rhodanobacteraceae bacterium]|nr:tetraacyldisaccharide 4'-kinase [Rhodanobacteraceae bacterium]
MALARDVERRWYDGTPPSLPLRLVAGLFRFLSAARRGLYRRGWLGSVRLPVPVVVIGNISVGGTGKTPLTIAIALELQRRGWRPGVVSRGHGGRATAPMLLDAQSDPGVVGDEPALIRAAGIPVAIGRDRVDAARLLLGQSIDVVLADDGLQHYRLARDVEICVIDGQRRFGNGWLLPAGPLREPPARLAGVDFRVVNGGAPGGDEIPMTLHGDVAVSLVESSRHQPLADFAGRRVHAVAGIGNPSRFFASLREQGIEVIEHAFPDHHAYVAADLDFGDGAALLMTDKDAIKCRPFAHDGCWRVPVQAQLPGEFFAQLDALLRRRQTPAALSHH